jgi:hypothetical protein
MQAKGAKRRAKKSNADILKKDTVIGVPAFYHSAINRSARLFNHGWTRMNTDYF